MNRNVWEKCPDTDGQTTAVKFRRADGAEFWALFGHSWESLQEPFTTVPILDALGILKVLDHLEGTDDEISDFLDGLKNDGGLFMFIEPASGFRAFVTTVEPDEKWFANLDRHEVGFGSDVLGQMFRHMQGDDEDD